jgi:CrcB protein
MANWLLHPVVLLSLGGAAGTNARYWLGVWINQWLTKDSPPGTTLPHFPLATFVVNVTGSLILGVAAVLFLLRPEAERRVWYLFLGVGFCGGYTTFSTFALETFDLFRRGQSAWAIAYIVASVLGAVLAVAAAIQVTHWVEK